MDTVNATTFQSCTWGASARCGLTLLSPCRWFEGLARECNHAAHAAPSVANCGLGSEFYRFVAEVLHPVPVQALDPTAEMRQSSGKLPKRSK
eukprot:5940168-Amphidinium_carterae.1